MAKMLETSASGRRCTFPHCTHILSIYNHETVCHVHRDQIAQAQKAMNSAPLNGRPLIVPR
jgi:hypothetical protein